MFEYFKMFSNLLQLYIIFLFYTGKRLFCRMQQYICPSYGMPNSENYNKSLIKTSKLDTRLLGSNSISYAANIIFLQICTKFKLFKGRISGLKTFTPWRSVKKDWCVKSKTASSIDELNLYYEGSLLFMNFELNFYANVILENVKIFTEFNVFPFGCESILENIYIDDMKLRFNTFNISLRNDTNYFVLSGILKIIFFFILSMLEFTIRLRLRSNFSRTDCFKMEPQNTLESQLMFYLDITKDLHKGSSPAKSFISVLNELLVEDNRNMLMQLFPQFQESSHEHCENGIHQPSEEGISKQDEDGKHQQKSNESERNQQVERPEKLLTCDDTENDTESNLNESVVTDLPDTDAESDSYNYFVPDVSSDQR